MVGGNASAGKVTLTRPAPAGGLVVSLLASDPNVVVPATVTVAAGTTTATFTATTVPVTEEKAVAVTARLGTTELSAELEVQPAVLASFTLSPSSLTGGASSTGTLTLSGPAPLGGLTVSLVSSSAAVVVPSTVFVAAGSTSATFTVATSPVGVLTTATVNAALGAVTKSANVTLKP